MSILFSRPKRPVRQPKKGLAPELWASRVPFQHPQNFLEVLRAAWENRDQVGYAWRILADGVCDGCALGTSGLRDWTVDGVHLCNIRLRLLRLNTMPTLDGAILADVAPLKAWRSRDLRELGRLPYPLVRRRGETGFTRTGWDDVLELIATRINATTPERSYVYLTSRGIPNETYYAAQKAVRAMGSNNIDNAARICHSPSTFGLKGALGVAATTCSYSDLIGTDLVTFLGSNVANNQPVVMKYLYHAKKAGTKVITINPYQEPGMDAYWVPSDLESAMFGTKISDRFFLLRPGGDIAFLHGTIKAMLEQELVDHAFISQHTSGFDALQEALVATSWELLEHESGLAKRDMEAYAALVGRAKAAVFVWGMGITQHARGEDNVQAIINLALTRGFVGREGCGLMPIRGHSGVQGGAEMGAYATALPGGKPVDEAHAAALSALYGFEVPSRPGLTTPEALDAAQQGELDVLFAVGGNFREVMPNPAGVEGALAKIPLRVHMDIALSSQMLIDPADTVVLLPATTRYEIPGGVSETSTERRIIFSPEIPGPRVPEARPEGQVLGELAARVRPELADKVRFASSQHIRAEIARVVPMYEGIQHLKQKGDSVQYGGPRLCAGWTFPTEDGKAHFQALPLDTRELGEAALLIVTRRGKQFNSMVHEDTDPLNRMPRDAIIVNGRELARLGLTEGAQVVLENRFGHYHGTLRVAEVAPRTAHVHWPEANVLIDPAQRSPLAKIPTYKQATARLRRADTGTETSSQTPFVNV